MQREVIEEEIYITGETVKLEGRLFRSSASCRAGVVICHPHPLYGGNMDNNVVLAIRDALAGAGLAVLRFNLRGVGRSTGSFAGGEGELEDARSAFNFLAARLGEGAIIGLAGYSFGGMIALRLAAEEERVKAIAVVSPVISPVNVMANCRRPKLVLTGGRDTLIPAQTIQAAVSSWSPPTEIEIIEGADHFWWGQEEKISRRLGEFFRRHLLNGGIGG